MTFLIYLTLSFLSLGLLDFYVKANILVLGDGSPHVLSLMMFCMLSAFLLIWLSVGARAIFIRRSTFLLVLFVAYFLFRVGVDVGNVERVKGLFIATTGGVVLYYGLGVLVSTMLNQSMMFSIKVRQYFSIFLLFLIIYACVSFGFLLSVFNEFLSKLRSDFFLIADIGSAYQRPGNFLAISYLVFSCLVIFFFSLKPAVPSLSTKIGKYFLLGLFGLYTVTSLVLSQMFGSNKTAVLIGGLCTLFLSTLMLMKNKRAMHFLKRGRLNYYSVTVGRIGSRIFFLLVMSLFLVAISIFMLATVTGLDISMTRLGGMGGGELSSVSSRLSLLGGFVEQFAYSPVFGNMNVDCIVSSCGRYVHGSFASLLTHTGLIGFFILIGYYFLASKELMSQPNVSSTEGVAWTDNLTRLYSLLSFFAVLLMSVVGTFFSWAVLWFAMGLCFNPIVFKN